MEYFAAAFPLEYLSDTVESLLLACYAGFIITEIPVHMEQRQAGHASTRHVQLLYHYLRLVLVLASMASLRNRRARRAVA